MYAASTAALCVLEVRVHLDLPFALIPADYVLVTIDLTGLRIERLADAPVDPVTFGDGWLRERRTPVLDVPSVIVPETSNLLLNPSHPEATEARVDGMRSFLFDERLWGGR